MHDCDVMLCLGARFDDRITGRLDAFSPGSKKIHVDIDPSSINKNVRVDVGIVGDCRPRAGGPHQAWRETGRAQEDAAPWWQQIERWRARNASAIAIFTMIKPQYALERLQALTASATSTSPPKSGSIRCGLRSSFTSKNRTAG